MVLGFTFFHGISLAEVVLGTLFRDGMVLQQGKPAAIWGTARGDETVRVEFKGLTKTTKVDNQGRWMLKLEALEASDVPANLTVTEAGTGAVTVVKDVVVGEVWLCSGQSNMHFFVPSVVDAKREMAEAKFPLIRQFLVESKVADQPQATAGGKWLACTPETVGKFTAVGYFFAREVHQDLKVPVGILHATLGGSPIEGWMSAPALASDPAFAVVASRWEQMRPQVSGDGMRNQPSGLYNGLIHPLQPFAMAGFLWYQGEGNCERAGEYSALFTTMIQQWRTDFQQPELPFLFVQLPNYEERRAGMDGAWPALREAQASALKLPRTGMAVTIDVGDAVDLHPRNKQAVGHRLALMALAKVYGREVAYSGPVFVDAKLEGAGVRVRFDHAAGLSFKGDAATAFELAGPDGKFVPAQAALQGETVIVSASSVHKPAAVRFEWMNVPTAFLVNAAGLPAAPFRWQLR